MQRFGSILTLLVIMVSVLGINPVMAQSPLIPINYGQTVDGELNDIQQALKYIFDAQTGDTITILMQTTSGDLDAALRLSTFDGEELATDENSGGGTDALILFEVRANGSYVIDAQRSRTGGGSGTFSLTLTLGEAPVPTVQQETVEVGPRLQPVLRGNTIQGALSPTQRFSLYWFEGRADETLSVTLDSGTSLQPILVLYDSRFSELARSNPASGTPLAATLTSNDLYFLAVSLPQGINAGGNYAFSLNTSDSVVSSVIREVEPGQNAIAYGDSVRGTVNTVNSAYTFQFRGAAGDIVTINMARAGGDLDSYLYLLDAGGVAIAENDNGGTSNGDANITLSLPADGDYLILATRSGGDAGNTAGNFLLTLQSDSTPIPIAPVPSNDTPPNLAEFPRITVGEAVTGSLSNSSFLNAFIFRADAEEEIVISMDATSGDLDPLLLLLDSQQVPLAENDDVAEGNQNSEIRFTVPTTGFYVAVATRFERELGATSGSYELTVQRSGDVVGDSQAGLLSRLDAEPIVPGTTPAGNFSAQQFINTYTFGVTGEGSIIDVAVTTDNNLPATIMLADERLQPLAVVDDGNLIGVTLPAAGNYLIFVAPAAGPEGTFAENYLLAFNATGDNFVIPDVDDGEPVAEATTEPDAEATPAPPTEEPIAYGEQVSGTLSDDADVALYVFEGNAEDNIRITMAASGGSGLDTLLQLLDSNGVVIGENDDIVPGENRNSLLQTTLSADDTYTIRATRFTPSDGLPATSGDYVLTLEQVDPSALGVSPTILPITSGQTINNEVNDDQYLMFYSFEGNGGDAVTIEVDTISGDLDAVLYLYTYSSGGDPIEIARNDDSPRGGTFDPLIENYLLPRSGTYLIAVGRFPEGTSTGEFTMTLSVSTPDAGGEDN